MGDSLPTELMLKKLTLRALVAYSARTARRLSIEIGGLVPDRVLSNVLDGTEQVCFATSLADIDVEALMRAVADLYDHLAILSDSYREAHVAGLCIARAATAARILADEGSTQLNSAEVMEKLVKKVSKAVSAVERSRNRSIYRMAAWEDYWTLAKEVGTHESPIVGDSITCFL